MKKLSEYQFWLIVGSQHLYGPQVLETVAQRAAEIAAAMNASQEIPCNILYKDTVKSPEEITKVIKEANYDDHCAGIIVWMHTFSPSKMWINGLTSLQKPYLHLHTQYNRNIPDNEIDMDYMNLNQAAHGDREHGFLAARLRLSRKIVVGYWRDRTVHEKIGSWMRSAIGAMVSQSLKVVRFGDNMRQVAVTEGDKVEAQIKLGWQVNTFPVGELTEEMNEVKAKEIETALADCKTNYDFATNDFETVRYQLREEIAIRRILEREKAGAFTNTFEDLYGMKQLPGLASQRLMEQGFGYGGEGDWKTAAMTHIIKSMTQGMDGGTTFMEDYTYDLEPGKELSLGAHMLEVCPTVAAGRPRVEVHPLGIGGREAPARLVFEGKPGNGIVVSLIDLGGRLRLIVQDIRAVVPPLKMPNLPVARIMWQAMPDLLTGAHAWILAGGAHHTVLSYDATPQMMEDLAEIMQIEYVHIDAHTKIEQLKERLFLDDLAWKLRNL